MALFKILRGSREALDGQVRHDGYAYFTPDTGEFFIDYLDNKDGQLYRKKISDTTKASVQICDWTAEEEIEYVSFTLTDSNYADALINISENNIVIPDTFEKNGIVYQVTAINNFFAIFDSSPAIINVPITVTEISSEDFSNYMGININYAGSEEQWNAICAKVDFNPNYLTETALWIINFNTYNG